MQQHQQYSSYRLKYYRALLIVGVLSSVLSSVQGDDYLIESPTSSGITISDTKKLISYVDKEFHKLSNDIDIFPIHGNDTIFIFVYGTNHCAPVHTQNFALGVKIVTRNRGQRSRKRAWIFDNSTSFSMVPKGLIETSFLKPCKIHDTKHGECLSNAIENIFTNWRDGVPGLKSIGSIDPFHVKKVHLEQNNPNINIKLDMKNVIITGLTHTNVAKSTVNKDYVFKFLLKIPKMYIKGDYRIKGSILLLRLNSTGPIQSELSDAEVILVFKANLIENFNQKFFDITSVQSNVKTVGNFHVNFGNLFGGNVELEDSANAIFNQNWRELFEIMRPVISETLDAITIDRYKKVFNYIPATYFFVDLP